MQEPQAWNLHLDLDIPEKPPGGPEGWEIPFITQRGRIASAVAGQSYRRKTAADQEQAEMFMPTSRGRGYFIEGTAAFSDGWEQHVLLG